MNALSVSRRYAAAVLVVGAVALAASGDDEPAKATVGKPAPAFEAPATSIETVLPDKKDAKKLSLKDFKGKKHVVLFFFPKAMTKG